VYEVHDWAKVKELVRAGVPKRHIAERLGCRRTSVYRLLLLETPPRYERAPAGWLLEPFKDAVAALLRTDATATATVIRQHLQRQGYAGGISILKEYLAGVRPAFLAARDFQRTVYAPGEILQADWWDTGVSVPVGKGATRRAYGMVTTLPFSAAHAVVYTHSQTTADAVPALLGCLTRLGGVPGKLVVDNDASLVVRAGRSRARPVDELAALLGALALGCVVLPPGAPQSKGSVARSNGYLETSFLPLREFADLAIRRRRATSGPRPRPGRATTGASGPGSVRRSPSSAPSSASCPSRCRPPTAAPRYGSAATAWCAPPASTTRCRRATPDGASLCTSTSLSSRCSARRAASPPTCAATCPPTWSATPSTWPPCARRRRRSAA